MFLSCTMTLGNDFSSFQLKVKIQLLKKFLIAFFLCKIVVYILRLFFFLLSFNKVGTWE